MTLLQRFAWRVAAILFFIIALIGVPLPGLPTVPFLLLSAWCAGKGWPRLERWLLQHPQFGPPILRWRQHGIISRKAKYLASLMISLSMCLLWLSSAPRLLAGIITLAVLLVLLWLWRRPEQPVVAEQAPPLSTTSKKVQQHD